MREDVLPIAGTSRLRLGGRGERFRRSVGRRDRVDHVACRHALRLVAVVVDDDAKQFAVKKGENHLLHGVHVGRGAERSRTPGNLLDEGGTAIDDLDLRGACASLPGDGSQIGSELEIPIPGKISRPYGSRRHSEHENRGEKRSRKRFRQIQSLDALLTLRYLGSVDSSRAAQYSGCPGRLRGRWFRPPDLDQAVCEWAESLTH